MEVEDIKKVIEDIKMTKAKAKQLAKSIAEDTFSKGKKHPVIYYTGAAALIVATSLLFSTTVKSSSTQDTSDTTKEAIATESMTEGTVLIGEIQNNQLDENAKAAIKENKPVVIKVTPTGYTYAEIYETIDYVKKLISENKINGPVLFNIESLMEEDTIRANCLLAEAFINKLTANGCYVGLYGSEESLERFSTAFKNIVNSHSIDLYDKLVVYDGDFPKYTGVYNMSKKSDSDIITFTADVYQAIADNNLNDASNFIEDKVYTVKSGDSLGDIANKVNMKVSDLAAYNHIDDTNNIHIGQEIKLPNQYQEELKIEDNVQQEEIENSTISGIEKGIDVSHHQGEINWEQTKEQIDYAIVRLCDFYHKQPDGTCKLDEQFYNNIQKCEELNIPVGIYYYSHATTEEEAKQEAKFVAECLKGYSLEYPVYMDIETEEQNKLIKENPTEMKKIIISAMTELEGEGYFSGVYCNGGSNGDTQRKEFIDDISNIYTCWITSNATYNTAVNFEEFNQLGYEILTIPTDQIAMYQYSQKGTIDGIEGNVDIDYANKNLTETIIEKGYNKIKTT